MNIFQRLLGANPAGSGLTLPQTNMETHIAPFLKDCSLHRALFGFPCFREYRDSEAVWLDLWNREFEGGLKVEIEDLTAGLHELQSKRLKGGYIGIRV